MKKNIKDIFDNYFDDTVDLKNSGEISADRIIECTKKRISEEKNMNTNNLRTRRKWSVPFIAAAAIAALTLTAFAAYWFLSPKDVATHLERYELAEVFSKEDTLFEMPAQTSGDYTIELLGMTSGKNLDEVVDTAVDKEMSYIVGAITKKNGHNMTDYSNLMITPLVEGYKPWQINIFTIGNGSKHSFLYEGVEYFLIECESIEIFADNQVYIAVYEGGAPSSSEFVISYEGKISFNETYNGTKALFEIPLDKSKANKDAVNSLLVELGFDDKDVIYSSQNIVEDENQHYEYEVPEDISINIDANDDDGTYEYIIE